MAEWFKAAVLKTVECQSSVGSNPTPSAKNKYQIHGEMAELAEGARLLSECMGKPVPRVRIPVSPPFFKSSRFGQCSRDGFFLWLRKSFTECFPINPKSFSREPSDTKSLLKTYLSKKELSVIRQKKMFGLYKINGDLV